MECNEANELSLRETLESLMSKYVETQKKLKEAKKDKTVGSGLQYCNSRR